VVETEAPALNKDGTFIEGLGVLPHDQEIAIGKKGLALEPLPTCVRRVGKKRISDRTLSVERLR
jgi:hypothetical protein